MRFLATYAGVILGIGSLVTTGCSESSGDDATGSSGKGGSGGAAGSAIGGAAGGGTAGSGATGGGTAGSGAVGGGAGGMPDLGIFGEADGQPFSLTQMMMCENLLPGITILEASFATGATSSQLMDITLMAIAPGPIDCEGGSSISYAPVYMEPATVEQYYMATQGIGSCAITIAKMPTGIGDSIVGTFTASLVPQSGTGPNMTISNGRFRALLQDPN
jgi:hypothetical protein